MPKFPGEEETSLRRRVDARIGRALRLRVRIILLAHRHRTPPIRTFMFHVVVLSLVKRVITILITQVTVMFLLFVNRAMIVTPLILMSPSLVHFSRIILIQIPSRMRV